jgi:hypothetical protein
MRLLLVALLAGSASAHSFQLTKALGGEAVLGCRGYERSAPTPAEHQDFFVTDMHSRVRGVFRYGSVSIGINGSHIELAASRPMALLVGGTFASPNGKKVRLAVTPGRVTSLRDRGGEGESEVGFVANFEVRYRGASRSFRGEVVCAVYDVQEFFETACPNSKAVVGSVCR